MEFKQLDRIFHFGRVCWSWKANTYIQAERKRPWRQNISGQYRHTYKQRERETDFMPFNCGEDCVGSSLVKIQLLELVMIMYGYGNRI